MQIIPVEDVSLKNRLKTDNDLVIIWDTPVKYNTGFVILVAEKLKIIIYLLNITSSQRVILGHLDFLVPSVAERSDLGKLLSYTFLIVSFLTVFNYNFNCIKLPYHNFFFRDSVDPSLISSTLYDFSLDFSLNFMV